MSWLFFALLTPLFFSASSFIEKFLIEKKVKDPIFIVILGGIFASIIGIGIAIFHGLSPISMTQLLALIAVGLLLTVYVIPYFKALSLDETSRVIPLFQFVPIFVLLLSQLFLKEQITSRQLFGFFVIITGGFLLGTEKISTKIFKLRPAFWYMMLSSFFYALAAILFKYVVGTVDFWTAFAYQSIAGILGSLLLFAYKPYRTSTYRELPLVTFFVFFLIILTTVVTFIADLSASYAYTLAPTALVTVVGGIQPLFVLIIGIVFSLFFPHLIKEDLTKKNIAIKSFSICLVLVGIYFINFK